MTKYNSYESLIQDLDRELIEFTAQQIEIAEYNAIMSRKAQPKAKAQCQCVCDNCLCD